MARGPVTLIRPEYHFVRDIDGGLDTNKPPDQIDDKASPDMNNLVYMNSVLCVDFGVRAHGSRVIGQPQRSLQWTSIEGTLFQVLVTTLTIYQWNNARRDWDPVPSDVAANPTLPVTLIGSGGSSVAITFTGVASWTTGQLIAVQIAELDYTPAGWLVGVADGTTSPVTIDVGLPIGRMIPAIINSAPATIFPLPTFTSDGNKLVSSAVDPERNILIFVNGHDPVQKFDGITCKPLGGCVSANIDTANYVARYHSVTVLGGTVELGTPFPYRIRRSATGDSENWTTLDAGFDDLLDTGDAIVGLAIVNPYLIVFCSSSVVRASYLGNGQQVFWYDYGLSHTGPIGAQAFSFDKLHSEFVSEQGIFGYAGDQGLTDLGDAIFDSLLSYTGDLNPFRHDFLFMFYVPNLDETWIFYPSGSAMWANKVFRLNHKNGSWFPRSFAPNLSFNGFGFWRSPGTIRWVDIEGNWLSRHKPWNARSSQQNYNSILLTGATDNQVYIYDFNNTTTDAGTPISWYFVSKDFPLPTDWETLDGIAFYGKGIVDLVEISTDFGVTFHQLGANIVLGPTWARGDLDCSLTCQFIRVRFSGLDPSFKLSWFAFKTMKASER